MDGNDLLMNGNTLCITYSNITRNPACCVYSVFIFLTIIRPNSTIFSKTTLTCWCFLMEVRCVLCKVGIRFPKGSIIGLVLFIMYINDLPLRINSASQPILFADNGSVIISGRNFEHHCSISNLVDHMIKCMLLIY